MQEPSSPPPAGPAASGRRRLPQADRREIAAIFAGGALGTLARAALADAFPQPATAWPWPNLHGQYRGRVLARVLRHPAHRTPAAVQLPAADVTGPGWSPGDLHEATKLTIYLGRQERAGRIPAFVAVCDLLHRRGVDGATALLGVDGTAHGRRERAAFFSRNAEVCR